MFERRIPEWLRHAPAPFVPGFAVLAAFEAVARGILISVFPVAMYDAAPISSIYFAIGIISLLTGLLVPFLNRKIPRRWMYSIGASGFVIGYCLAVLGTPEMIVLALVLNLLATVVTFVCFNAYVLDYISRVELGKCETLRMFYSALGWAVGPVLGVVLWGWWKPAPFLISGVSAMIMLGAFLYLRMGNRLRFSGTLGHLTDPANFKTQCSKLRRVDWVAYAKRPFGGPQQVLAYLGRYTHRVATANSRLIDMVDDRIRLRWKNYRKESVNKGMVLSASEFIRRFLLHVLPPGFHRIRHFGFMANGHRTAKTAMCRELLMAGREDSADPSTAQNAPEVEPEPNGKGQSTACSCCGGRMHRITVIPRPACCPTGQEWRPP